MNFDDKSFDPFPSEERGKVLKFPTLWKPTVNQRLKKQERFLFINGIVYLVVSIFLYLVFFYTVFQ